MARAPFGASPPARGVSAAIVPSTPSTNASSAAIAVVASIAVPASRDTATPLFLSRLAVAICVLVFSLETLLDLLGVIPRDMFVSLFGLSYEGLFRYGRFYQFVTAPFVHVGIVDLVLNMLALATTGLAVERTVGRRTWMTLTTGSACASMSAFLLFRSPDAIATGCSDAVFGLLVAHALLDPDARVMVYGLFPLKMKHTVLLLAVLVAFPSVTVRGSIGQISHLAGAGVAWAYMRRRRPSQTQVS